MIVQGNVWSWFLHALGLLASRHYRLSSTSTGYQRVNMNPPCEIQFLGQDYQRLKQECLEKKIYFVDKTFTKAKALGLTDGSGNEINEIENDEEFIRPHEIVKDPKFAVDGISRFDVKQGYPMDCWLASSLASLTLNKDLLANVVPDDNSFEKDYAGIFHFRFWHYGIWTEVVIDDRLPVFYKKLDNMQSSEENEFWSALLEKAYAKVKGGYKALNGGEPEEALVDFTGGITVTHFFKEKKPPVELFDRMQKACADGDLMVADIYPTNSWTQYTTGLHQGHGYSITKVVLLEYERNDGSKVSEHLIRVRNPYGNQDGEWTGEWSDKSDKWKTVPEKIREDLKVTCRPDGEFWMTFEDYYKYFTLMMILYVPYRVKVDGNGVSFVGEQKWTLKQYDGVRTVEESTGSITRSAVSKTPQHAYKFKVEEKSKDNVLIGVMQKYRREHGLAMLPIGVSIYKVGESSPEKLTAEFLAENKPVGTVEDPENGMREASGAFTLEPGHYCAVPYTFLLNDGERVLPEENIQFLLRIFVKNPTNTESQV